uniref:Uncharacterized protein n=1 Tax=Picea glauca TaxID=3330 RepID=A0A101M4X3_PICGL|nr:hypothetical protein ABT39_MTgene2708 [Picea glauca]KUM46070.1 hypothetical protein ABT39_MTgene1876 [Picea glauca]KUM51043.1 hypothetical protein ABT39_MTgene889 [Picea glauca]QHR92517.1 hypothetical protein Q903MT_gene6563 [Picea sitchensis]
MYLLVLEINGMIPPVKRISIVLMVYCDYVYFHVLHSSALIPTYMMLG